MLYGILKNADHLPAVGCTLSATSVVAIKPVLGCYYGSVASPFLQFENVIDCRFVFRFNISVIGNISKSFYSVEKAQGSGISEIFVLLNKRPEKKQKLCLNLFILSQDKYLNLGVPS